MARKRRASNLKVWKRIPRDIRPTWEEFKKMTYDYGSARSAEMAILQAVVNQMEKNHEPS